MKTTMPGAAMRLITLLFLCSLGNTALAADAAPQPATAPPPPPMDASEAVDEPQVTITTQTEQTVEEYRVGGRLYMIKITPKSGKPYYLVDDRGDGKFSRMEGLDSGVRPPRWVLREF